MSFAKILLLLGVIALIHIVVIYGCMYTQRDQTSAVPVETMTARENLFGKIFTPVPESSASENHTQWLNRSERKKPEKKRDDMRVKPWIYGKTAALPRNLDNQAKRARSGIIVDLASRQVLWEKNSRTPVAIASLTKLMSALLIAEKVGKEADFTLDTTVKLSKTAAAEAYRKFDVGDQFTVHELIQAMIIGSSNDAAVQLAECVAGSADVFIAEMNVRAEKMGLTSADFNSVNGLPKGPKKINAQASAADVLHLCEALMAHKIIMDACGENHVKLANGRELYTTNGLLLHPRPGRTYYRRVPGLIGFKTGFTNAAGFCLAFGVTRNGKTVLGCVTGFPSAADRERFCSDLIEWAYKNEQVKK